MRRGLHFTVILILLAKSSNQRTVAAEGRAGGRISRRFRLVSDFASSTVIAEDPWLARPCTTGGKPGMILIGIRDNIRAVPTALGPRVTPEEMPMPKAPVHGAVRENAPPRAK